MYIVDYYAQIIVIVFKLKLAPFAQNVILTSFRKNWAPFFSVDLFGSLTYFRYSIKRNCIVLYKYNVQVLL